MKKILYSPVLKFLAVILFCASITLGTLSVGNGVATFYNGEPNIYSFERDFSESWYMESLVHAPYEELYTAYLNYYVGYDENGNLYSNEMEELDEYLYQELRALYCDDRVDYFIQWNHLTFTNCEAKSADEIPEGEFYFQMIRDGSGNVEWTSTLTNVYMMDDLDRFDITSRIVIACNVKNEVVEECRALWETQESIVTKAFFAALACVILALLLLVYLLAVCGKTPEGEYKNLWIDHIFLEFHLAWMVILGVGAVWICAVVIDEYQADYFQMTMMMLVLAVASAIGSLGILTSLLSIVRNIKTKRLVATSFLFRTIRWSLRTAKRILRWTWRMTKAFWRPIFRLLSKKSGVFLLVMLIFYTILVGLLGIGAVISPMYLLLGILLFGFAAFLVACRGKDLDAIQMGVAEIRGGNLAYKIPGMKSGDLRSLAENINTIAQGLEESVAARVKAERMKSELITNVSHDLKTPITSVISYTRLLSQMEDLPEEARDYVAVIAKKSDRLKKLTQDLFDISKVQSGNDEVTWEKLNLVLLLNQALGEHDSDIQSSGLPFCVKAPKEACILADGRKLSRVLDNLISNVLKYTMPNTRVFLTVTEMDGEVMLECKNISAYPLDFDVEEITQRFVRGDESRSTEGNGLGLAIAKSYTELCGGKFEVVADGDMFKAILRFASCN